MRRSLPTYLDCALTSLRVQFDREVSKGGKPLLRFGGPESTCAGVPSPLVVSLYLRDKAGVVEVEVKSERRTGEIYRLCGRRRLCNRIPWHYLNGPLPPEALL